MPVQNSNSKNSAHPDWATHLLQILIPPTYCRLLCQKGQFTLQPCPRKWYYYFFTHRKLKLNIFSSHFCLSKNEVFWKDRLDRSWLLDNTCQLDFQGSMAQNRIKFKPVSKPWSVSYLASKYLKNAWRVHRFLLVRNHYKYDFEGINFQIYVNAGKTL